MDRSVIYFLLFLSSKGVYPIISKRFIFKVKKTSFLAGETLHYIYNGVWMVQRLFKQFKEDSAHQIGCFFFFSFSKGGSFFGVFFGYFSQKKCQIISKISKFVFESLFSTNVENCLEKIIEAFLCSAPSSHLFSQGTPEA